MENCGFGEGEWVVVIIVIRNVVLVFMGYVRVGVRDE